MRVTSTKRAAIAAAVGIVVGGWAGAVLAQYPQISDDLRKQAEAAKAEADRRSDEAFARAIRFHARSLSSQTKCRTLPAQSSVSRRTN